MKKGRPKETEDLVKIGIIGNDGKSKNFSIRVKNKNEVIEKIVEFLKDKL